MQYLSKHSDWTLLPRNETKAAAPGASTTNSVATNTVPEEQAKCLERGQSDHTAIAVGVLAAISLSGVILHKLKNR